MSRLAIYNEQGSIPAAAITAYAAIAPDFTCIHYFVIPGGWDAQFTEHNIHRLFPDFDQFVSNT